MVDCIDFSDSEQVMTEMFDSDQWVKDKFLEYFHDEFKALAVQLASAFSALPKLNLVVNERGDEQSALVAGFIYGVVDDLLTSTKLLITGKMMPAGNLMRQAIEGVAISLLCSSRDFIAVKNASGKTIQVRYWQRLKEGSPLVRGHASVSQLAMNCGALSVSNAAVQRLCDAKIHYNQFSHAGLIGIAARVELRRDGVVFAGGHFDTNKIAGYHVEIKERIGLCSILPQLIDGLTERMA